MLENTVEPRPKGQSLARATASASVWYLTTARTGPNTSSLHSNSKSYSAMCSWFRKMHNLMCSTDASFAC